MYLERHVPNVDFTELVVIRLLIFYISWSVFRRYLCINSATLLEGKQQLKYELVSLHNT